jgi:hypothetical protein
VRDLHHLEWAKVREEALLNGSTDVIYTHEDYTLVPRGRVFSVAVPNSDIEFFEVLVGSWHKDYPQALELIMKEFNLENTQFQFIHSEHWDIGRGTSELFI